MRQRWVSVSMGLIWSVFAQNAWADPSVSQAEYDRRVLHIYSTFAYEALNNQLRSLIWYEGFPGRKVPVAAGLGAMDALDYKLWHHVDSALGRLPEHVGKVFRGVGRSSTDWIAAAYPKGAIVREAAFTSTARNEAAAAQFGPVILEIESLMGRDISAMSYNADEVEVLFRSGSVFEVTNVVKARGRISRVFLRELDERKLSGAQAKALAKADQARQHKLMQESGYLSGRQSLARHARAAKDMIDALAGSGALEAQDLTIEQFEAGLGG